MRSCHLNMQTFAVSIGAILITILTSGARAQSGGRALENAMRPDYQERDVAVGTVLLDLRTDQQDEISHLIGAYLGTFRIGSKQLRAEVDGARIQPVGTSRERQDADRAFRQQVRELVKELKQRQVDLGDDADLLAMRQEYKDRVKTLRHELGLDSSTSDQPAMVAQRVESHERISIAIEAWSHQKRSMADALVVAIKATLDPAQRERWPAFERRLTRDRFLSTGRLSGESVNLFAVIDKSYVPGDSAADVHDVLNEYGTELHRALQARRRTLAATELVLTGAMIQGDQDAAAGLMTQQAEARVRVRDINDRFASALKTALGTSGPAFHSRYVRDAYRRAYQDIAADRSFRQAMTFQLDEATAAQLDLLRQSYNDERQRLNAWLVEILKREEPNEPARRFTGRLARLSGGDARPDPIRDALSERQILSRQYLRLLEELLGADRIGSRSEFGADTAR